ncbi:MAG TPA: 30S ribosome-binding factor RbfA [Candidatus Goldiibacteriota bacterium]|nr:30S ribosome-binding factor RbfA [Candidatus Goldiibacteriota bacterium]HRQ43455.1 30S ribosome-binding factor RbfA [Candidatus Goldiibacteriota bacterium]
MQGIRKQKVESLMKREISTIIMREVKDPRIGFVTVHSVSLTNDLREAHIYISVMGDEEQKKKSLEGLRQASGFIRGQVGDAVKLRHTPELIFKMDNSYEERLRVENLFRQIEEEKKHDKETGE